jgi:antitoxin MazE
MKVDLVRIGNSLGIRLPKALIEQCGLDAGIEMEVRGQEIVLKAASRARKPREGWAGAFKGAEDEPMLLGEFSNEFDAAEWTWPEKGSKS